MGAITEDAGEFKSLNFVRHLGKDKLYGRVFLKMFSVRGPPIFGEKYIRG